MKISIEYCGTCNYRPIAAVLAAMIKNETGIKPELVHSFKSGSFEVFVDGNLFYSKLATGYFPDNAELAASLKASAAPAGTGEER